MDQSFSSDESVCPLIDIWEVVKIFLSVYSSIFTVEPAYCVCACRIFMCSYTFMIVLPLKQKLQHENQL